MARSNFVISVRKSETNGYFRNSYSLWCQSWLKLSSKQFNDVMWVSKVQVILCPRPIFFFLGQLNANFICLVCRTMKWKFIFMHMVTGPRWLETLQKPSPELIHWLPWNLVFSIEDSGLSKFVQMVTIGSHWHILCQGQIWSHVFLFEKMWKQ